MSTPSGHPCLQLPRTVGGRARARALLSSVDGDLRETVLTIDATALEMSTPSFVDEVVRLSIDRGVRLLRVHGLSDAEDRDFFVSSFVKRTGSADGIEFSS